MPLYPLNGALASVKRYYIELVTNHHKSQVRNVRDHCAILDPSLNDYFGSLLDSKPVRAWI